MKSSQLNLCFRLLFFCRKAIFLDHNVRWSFNINNTLSNLQWFKFPWPDSKFPDFFITVATPRRLNNIQDGNYYGPQQKYNIILQMHKTYCTLNCSNKMFLYTWCESSNKTITYHTVISYACRLPSTVITAGITLVQLITIMFIPAHVQNRYTKWPQTFQW